MTGRRQPVPAPIRYHFRMQEYGTQYIAILSSASPDVKSALKTPFLLPFCLRCGGATVKKSHFPFIIKKLSCIISKFRESSLPLASSRLWNEHGCPKISTKRLLGTRKGQFRYIDNIANNPIFEDYHIGDRWYRLYSIIVLPNITIFGIDYYP